MMGLLPQRVHAELPRMIRFLAVGALTALLSFGLYALLSRIVFPNGNRTAEQTVATVVASVFNYLAHRRITYRSKGSHRVQTFRYLLVWTSAVLLQAALLWIGHEALEIHDFVVLFIITGMIACYTYLIHRLYTFRVIIHPNHDATPV